MRLVAEPGRDSGFGSGLLHLRNNSDCELCIINNKVLFLRKGTRRCLARSQVLLSFHLPLMGRHYHRHLSEFCLGMTILLERKAVKVYFG